jgi:predicted flap endonuclease-1-like 5' DNA nuclease
MIYLIVQTFVLLLIAGLLGLLFGWYLTRISAASARATLQTRLRNAEKDARDLRAELDALATAKGNCDTERRVLSDELADLRARQDAQHDATEDAEAVAELRNELQQCREALAASNASGVVERAGPEADTVADMTAPPLLPDAEEGADELQQIKGIGPKIAGILEQLGIRRFEQIAAWTPENVEWVNAHLKFKGRVEREEWIAQAKALVADREVQT